jgi:lysophospholipid acyltransferase (LPLAT)-like uncharacterized protein
LALSYVFSFEMSSGEPAQQDARLANPDSQGGAYWDIPRELTVWQKITIPVIAQVASWLVSLIGRTIRWESQGDEYLDQIHKAGKRAIFTFWHGRIFPATYYWRKRGIVVMTSQNYDGEYIARCIQKQGYGAARGSSSRGGLKALAEMAQFLRKGRDVAFTVDGPRGPRCEAKPGPVLLARKTGDPIFCFHISLEKKIQLNSWDQAQIPLPYTRAKILKAPPIYVSRHADETEINQKIKDVQRVLDQMHAVAEGSWAPKKVNPF